jgi:hypothetical protein
MFNYHFKVKLPKGVNITERLSKALLKRETSIPLSHEEVFSMLFGVKPVSQQKSLLQLCEEWNEKHARFLRRVEEKRKGKKK